MAPKSRASRGPLMGQLSMMKPIIDVVTVGDTSATLETLLGKVIDPKTRAITLVPLATGIYMDDGVASADSHPMGADPMQLVGDADTLDELEFYAATDKKMTVIQWG